MSTQSTPVVTEHNETDLLQRFADLKRRFGDDLGLVIAGLHCEFEARVEALESKLAKLEGTKRR
jgi:hypothetical protein